MADNVVDFASKRPPVRYSVHIEHYYTGDVQVCFDGITSTPTREDKEALLFALKSAVSLIEHDIKVTNED